MQYLIIYISLSITCNTHFCDVVSVGTAINHIAKDDDNDDNDDKKDEIIEIKDHDQETEDVSLSDKATHDTHAHDKCNCTKHNHKDDDNIDPGVQDFYTKYGHHHTIKESFIGKTIEEIRKEFPEIYLTSNTVLIDENIYFMYVFYLDKKSSQTKYHYIIFKISVDLDGKCKNVVILDKINTNLEFYIDQKYIHAEQLYHIDSLSNLLKSIKQDFKHFLQSELDSYMQKYTI